MFGKNGGALSSWIKEFCTLVFLQTIQAFIYALIISLIVMINFSIVVDPSDRSAAIGILSIIALTSVFKIEEMLKKIFGISNTKADHKGAMASLAKTAIAFKFGKRVLDNTGKITGGIKERSNANKAAAKAKSRLQRDSAMYAPEEDRSSQTQLPEGSGGNDFAADGGASYAEPYMDHYNNERAAGTMNEPKVQTTRKTAKPTRNLKEARDYQAMLDKYEDQLDNIKKQKREGTKQIIKGIVETGGGIAGGAAGAIIAGADGNLDEALRGVMSGAGVGDAIGSGIVDAAVFPIEKVQKATKAVQKLHKAVSKQDIEGQGIEKGKNTVKAYWKEMRTNKKAIGDFEQVLKQANKADASDAN